MASQSSNGNTESNPLREELIREALREVYDPDMQDKVPQVQTLVRRMLELGIYGQTNFYDTVSGDPWEMKIGSLSEYTALLKLILAHLPPEVIAEAAQVVMEAKFRPIWKEDRP